MPTQRRRYSEYSARQTLTDPQTPEMMAQSTGMLQRFKNDGWFHDVSDTNVGLIYGMIESWVEIASQPSSSSLSSIDADPHHKDTGSPSHEIVTTGLRVADTTQAALQRRRRRRASAQNSMAQSRPVSSSQEEYEESESEEEGDILTSSNDNIPRNLSERGPSSSSSRHPSLVQRGVVSLSTTEDEDEDDVDETTTAIGITRSNTIQQGVRPGLGGTGEFTPQPNAFSHPPATQFTRPSTQRFSSDQYTRSTDARPRLGNRSMSAYNRHTAARNGPFADDHDAALRASLTTLLSCAAAARGLPKREERGFMSANTVGRANDMPMLRMVTETELAQEEASPSALHRNPTRAPTKGKEKERSPTRDGLEKATKRKASVSNGNAKKKRSSSPTSATPFFTTSDGLSVISPALLPWVVSAGVVVLVSVVGFGAGYVIGREVGRNEIMLSAQGHAGLQLGVSGADMNSSGLLESSLNCGRESVRSGAGAGLRRLRSVAV